MSAGMRIGGSTFSRDAALMLGGTLLSQLLVLAVMPFFTRVYPPSAIGAAALFMSWTATLSVIGTMRLDLAAILPKESKEASVLGRLIVVQSLVLAAATALVVVVWGEQISQATGDTGSTWAWFVAPMCLCLALTHASKAMATRERSFGKITILNICSSAGFAVWGASLWVGDLSSDGLVVARLMAETGCVALAVYLGLLRPLGHGPRLSWSLAKSTYRRYYQFLVFNTPYSFFGTIARDLPVLIFSFVNSTATAGYYALARTILVAPTSLVSAALSQVFYKEAVDYLNQPRLEMLARRILWVGLMFGFPVFAFISVWGDVVFSTVFGEKWDAAGTIAMVLSPAMWFCLQTGWMQRIFETTGRQKLSFQLQVFFDAAIIGTMVVVLTFSQRVLPAVVAYSVLFAANNVAYLIAGLRVAGFASRPFVRDLVVASAFFVAFVGVGGVLRLSGLSTTLAFTATAVAAVATVTFFAFAFRQRYRDAPRSGS